MNLIGQIRKQRGLTQKAACGAMNVPQSTLSRLETNGSSGSGMAVETVRRIESFFGYPLRILIKSVSEPNGIDSLPENKMVEDEKKRILARPDLRINADMVWREIETVFYQVVEELAAERVARRVVEERLERTIKIARVGFCQ